MNLITQRIFLVSFGIFLFSCAEHKEQKNTPGTTDLKGTWELVSAKKIVQGDTTVTFPIENVEMVKIFNDTHFAFFQHATKDKLKPDRVYGSGGGIYTLTGSSYKEHLIYCSAVEWEDKTFDFDLQIRQDTLIQTGVEKIDVLNMDQTIIEVYVRKK